MLHAHSCSNCSKESNLANKCFRGSLNLPMAKATNENISALMSITKKDRDSVICALNQVLEREMLHRCHNMLHNYLRYMSMKCFIGPVQTRSTDVRRLLIKCQGSLFFIIEGETSFEKTPSVS